jgi:hypothetical protein
MWFRQAESAFCCAQVVDSLTKYDHVLTKLPEAYEQLKSRLLSSFGQSKWQLINKPIDHQDLGARRPSSLMDQMLTLLPAGEKPGLLFIGLFLKQLPVEYRDHLAAKEFSSPRTMAEYADNLWDARGGASQCVAAMLPLLQRASRLPGRAQQRQQRGRSIRRHSSSRSSSWSTHHRQQTPGPEPVCWFHQEYGMEARKCKSPCSFVGNALAGGGN